MTGAGWEALIGDYAVHLFDERGLSGHTVRGYTTDLRSLARITGMPVHEIRLPDIRAWLATLADDGVAAATLQRRVACTRGFFAWATREGYLAQDPASTKAAMLATESCRRPRWAKLTPAVVDLVPIALAAAEGGADAVVLTNTLPAMTIDPSTRRPRLGGGGGGLSGPAMHPVAVRAVHDVHKALAGLPIVGVGGIASGTDAVEMMLAGASAVEVGTAGFADEYPEVAGWISPNPGGVGPMTIAMLLQNTLLARERHRSKNS